VQWLRGALAEALIAAPHGAGKPLVMMISRGRLMLRSALAAPDVAALESWLRLFETAMREARRAGTQAPEQGAPSTQPSLWSASAMAADEHKV